MIRGNNEIFGYLGLDFTVIKKKTANQAAWKKIQNYQA